MISTIKPSTIHSPHVRAVAYSKRFGLVQLANMFKIRYCNHPERLYAGRYQLHSVLGIGGFAVVFKATDTKTGTIIALKITNRDFTSFLEEEALATMEISSPPYRHLPRFLDSNPGDSIMSNSTYFLALEYIDGQSLRELRELGKLPRELTLAIASQVCCGLWAASMHDIIHKDMHSGNVMVGVDGVIRVIDFGFSLYSPPRGVRIGEAWHVSPEHFTCHPTGIDQRSDIYSVGLLMVEMLTGIAPFSHLEPTSRELFIKKISMLPPPIPLKDHALQELIDSAADPKLSRRLQRHEELYEAIESLKDKKVSDEKIRSQLRNRIDDYRRRFGIDED